MKKQLLSIIIIAILTTTGFSVIAQHNNETNIPTTTNTTLRLEIMNNDFDTSFQIGQTLGVHAVIHNTGLINATSVQWSLTLKGGLIFLGRKASGTIPVMFPDQSIIVSIPFVSGLGTTTINASVFASNANQVTEQKQGKMRIFNVQIIPGTKGALTINLEKIVSGLRSPLLLTNAKDGSGRLFVVEQTGQVRIIKNGALLVTPFLDVSGKMVNISKVYDERGLLGLAFHPNYTNNGRFFVFYSAPTTTAGMDHKSVIAEYKVDPLDSDKADPASATILLAFDCPQSNHDGGQLAFGPDGMLYIGVGDGGSEGDQHGPIGNGQNTSTYLAKVLRIDVDHGSPYAIPADNPFVNKSGTKEIYAWGFRNPYRFSFDNQTGRLFVADVGQDKWEEIDQVENGKNYGWRIMEGNHLFDPILAQTMHMNLSNLSAPLFDYSHFIGHAIIGGYVYRGSQSPTLKGMYIYGDWSDSFFLPRGQLFYLQEASPGVWKNNQFKLSSNAPLHLYIQAIGQDQAGELYVLTQKKTGSSSTTGEVWHIVGA
jgi:glucose/arabinose dehydrogenase